MDTYKRHTIIWKILYKLLRIPVTKKFNLEYETANPPGPCIVVPNHVCQWDPLLVAMCFPEKQMYFVSSEHLFRKGILSKILIWLVEPIARKKATTEVDTAKACLRHLRAGHSICIFPEGEACWDGISGPIFPNTGRLVKKSGASLVCVKIQGGYLADPRWGKGIRRGKVNCRAVRIYSPQELAAMSYQEIDAAISRDIYEDAWQTQRRERTAFTGKNPARYIESALFMCPQCHKIGTLRGSASTVCCQSCGFSTEFGPQGFFQPARPFETIAQWDKWQMQKLKALDFPAGEELFSDEKIVLSRIEPGHREKKLCEGRLVQKRQSFAIGQWQFAMDEIRQMAMVQSNLLLFLCGGEYYQLKAPRGVCLRKYDGLKREG